MKIVELKVKGDSGNTYTIDLASSGLVRCSCPSFIYSEHRTCKHIEFASERLTLASA